MKTIFLSLAILGIGLTQGQDSQLNGLINGNGNLDSIMRPFPNFNVQPFGSGGVQLNQDQLITSYNSLLDNKKFTKYKNTF